MSEELVFAQVRAQLNALEALIVEWRQAPILEKKVSRYSIPFSAFPLSDSGNVFWYSKQMEVIYQHKNVSVEMELCYNKEELLIIEHWSTSMDYFVTRRYRP